MARLHPLLSRLPLRLLPPKRPLRKSLPRKRKTRRKTKRRKREKKPRPPLLPRRVPHKFRSRARKKKLALRPSSVRSPVNTASIFPRFLAPDLAAAFRSKPSCPASGATRQRGSAPHLLRPRRHLPRELRLVQPHRPLLPRTPATWFP